jgi:hypothetical protein
VRLPGRRLHQTDRRDRIAGDRYGGYPFVLERVLRQAVEARCLVQAVEDTAKVRDLIRRVAET